MDSTVSHRDCRHQWRTMTASKVSSMTAGFATAECSVLLSAARMPRDKSGDACSMPMTGHFALFKGVLARVGSTMNMKTAVDTIFVAQGAGLQAAAFQQNVQPSSFCFLFSR